MSSVPGLYGVTAATNILSYSFVLEPGTYGFEGPRPRSMPTASRLRALRAGQLQEGASFDVCL
jgi:hypothetical protein